MLPPMRAAGVRYVQVPRHGHSESEGIEVLDDSTSPTQLHVDGSYRLSTELIEAGTIPTSGGLRKCSLKFKGWVLDTFLQRDLAGAPYVHVIGFEADELKRVEKDQCYGGVGSRTASYPLVEWGWDRAACLAYIREATGVDWGKSACTFCPFSQARGEVLARYRANPEAAAVVLLMEANALGNVSVTGASGVDEDLLVFTPAQLGATTSGTWAMYFDGSDVGLSNTSNEDVNGVWVEAAAKVHLTTLGNFSVTGVSGDGSDVFVCTPGSLGSTTTCTWAMYWDGSANGFAGEDTDSLSIIL